MSDPIDRQAAIDAKMPVVIDGQAIDVVPVSVIKRLPSAQPKHGKWIDIPYVPSHTKYMCSECGKTIYTNSDYIKEHKFCFSCGADMRGNEDGIKRKLLEQKKL